MSTSQTRLKIIQERAFISRPEVAFIEIHSKIEANKVGDKTKKL